MTNYYSPADVLEGIDNMEYGKNSKIDIILTIALNFETQAKQVLTSNAHAPDFDTYYYVPDTNLTEKEIRKDKREWEHCQWVNEATHLDGHPNFLINQAANTILEAGSLRHFIEIGKIEMAIVAMANLVACGLLHLDANKDKAISVLSNKHKKNSIDGGNGRKGHIDKDNIFIEALYNKIGCKQLKPRGAAIKIMECLLSEEEPNYLSKKELDLIQRLYNPDELEEISYRIAGKEKVKEFTEKRIETKIREIINRKSKLLISE